MELEEFDIIVLICAGKCFLAFLDVAHSDEDFESSSFKAQAVSMPSPEEQPVMRANFPGSLPSRSLSWTI
jgi:hypothetical protein